MLKKSVRFDKKSKSEKPLDLSQCVPPKLYDRIVKMVPLPFPKNDPFEEKKKLNFRELLEEFDPVLLKNLGDDVNEENFGEAIDNYLQNKEIDLNIEPRAAERKIFQQDVNWSAEYMKKMKKERIVWQTKLFKENKEISEKPLFEQTEELIDVAAEDFAVWLKQMDDESNINKEFVKQLFSIQVEGDASKALYVEPKEIAVIPHEVSKILKLPHLSAQNNVIKLSRKDKRLRERKPHTVAFGRCLPKALRVSKFNEDLFDELYEVNCPEDIRSLKIVFDSILHLSATQQLIEHLKKNPELPRAKYLVDNDLFDAKPSSKLHRTEKPLWSYFY